MNNFHVDIYKLIGLLHNNSLKILEIIQILLIKLLILYLILKINLIIMLFIQLIHFLREHYALIHNNYKHLIYMLYKIKWKFHYNNYQN